MSPATPSTTTETALDRSIALVFAEAAARSPDSPFLRSRTIEGEDYTYAGFHARSTALAGRLVGLGVKIGDPVAILSENRPSWCVAYAAVLIAGGVVVPIDAGFSEDGVVNVLADSKARLLFLSDDQRRRVGERLARDLPQIALLPIAGLPEGAEGPLPEPAAGDAIAAIIYTSGTTGTPKGVVLTHKNLRAEIAAVDGAIHVHDDVLLMFLPLNHVLGQLGSFVLAAAFSCRVVHVDVKRGEDLLRAVKEEGVTLLVAVPLLYHLIHERIAAGVAALPKHTRMITRALMRLNGATRRIGINFGPRVFKKVHAPFGPTLRYMVSGGAKLDPTAQRDFWQLGFTLGQAYGLTETSGAAVLTPADDIAIGSAGQAAPGVEIHIDRPDPAGVGEVWLRGPLMTVGYYGREEATAELIDGEGWLHTGDLGYTDTRGNLFITGRSKDVIVLGSGKNIYPDELEAHYEKWPYIKELCILGRVRTDGPDKTEKLHAVVVPDFEALRRDGVQSVRIAIHDGIEKLSQSLPAWQRVLSFEIRRDPLPRTATRKLQRFLVELDDGDAGESPEHVEDPADPALFEQEPGRTVLDVVRGRLGADVAVRAGSSLELDLGLDSLNRMELFLSVEQALGVKLSDEDAQAILTVRDIVLTVTGKDAAGRAASGGDQDPWRRVLEDADDRDIPEWLSRGRSVFLNAGFFVTMVFLRVFGWIFLRFSIRGQEHLPERGPFLICPNHQSYLDGLLLGAFLPGTVRGDSFAVGATVHVSGPLQRVFARMLRILPIDSDRAIRPSMKTSAALLKQDRVLIIFPEGRRSFDGRLQALRDGAAVLACGLGVPILPCAIQGTFEALPRTRGFPRPAKVTYTYGPLLRPEPGESPAAMTARLRAALIAMGVRDGAAGDDRAR